MYCWHCRSERFRPAKFGLATVFLWFFLIRRVRCGRCARPSLRALWEPL